ncbi:MAG: hypothetical protein JNM83_05135 [Myxococcales bacterium]|nr:hypothetical protein [Myxococcales bacterium]
MLHDTLVSKGLPLRPRELLINDVDARITEESISDNRQVRACTESQHLGSL